MTRKLVSLRNNKIGKYLNKARNKQSYVINANTNPQRNNDVKSSKDNPLDSEHISSQTSPSSPSITYLQLFRYSTICERTLIIAGLLMAAIASFGLPIGVILYGEFTSLMVDRTIGIGKSTTTHVLSLFGGGQILINGTKEENRLALITDSQAFGIGSACVAFIQFITCAIGVDLVNYAALKQIGRIRKLFLEAVLRQDMTWYDTVTNNNFATKITDDLDKIREGIGEKLAIFTYLIMTFVISIIFSFLYGWKLTLVVLCCAPVIIISTAVVAKVQSSLTEKELKSYSKAGEVAEEVVSGIRTVVAFSGEQKEIDRYRERLRPAEKNGNKKGLYSGIGSGIMWFIIYCCYALAFWYGVLLIIDDRGNDIKYYTPATLVIVLFAVLTGAQNFGLTSPLIEAFATARGAAGSVFSVINRKPLIDSMGTDGLKPKLINGDIEFENIYFRYPSRNDVQVLNGLNLSIKAGETVALVGPSGCGKSTCLQLLQRLYDPMNGSVYIDGIKINELNTAWLRSRIGVVGQEPILFATTIGENIRYGNPSASQEDVENAAKIANCHSFILELPRSYKTMVGERGAQLSGGQKQRIAIARALVRNPRILLLDEATSALDPTSERRVQDALEKASMGRTTLVVSHRLSTITNADKIVFIQDGVVKEQGTHEQLMAQKTLYYDLVNVTNRNNESEENNDEKDSLSRKPRQYSHSTSILINDPSESFEEKNDLDGKNKLTESPDVYPVSMMRLMKLNSPEWKFMVVGCLAAILHGASLPTCAVLFGEFYGILSIQDSEEVAVRSINFSILFIVLGVVAGVGNLFQTYMFNTAGVRLTSRLRQMTFKAIVSQEMGYFDEDINSVGALSARLAGDCATVQGATGSRIGFIIQSLSTILLGIIISFFYSWDLTMVSLITVPFVLGSIFFESRYMAASNLQEKLALESASQLAVEAISNIRTVASLGQEPYVVERYCTRIDEMILACRKKTRFRGIVFSLGQSAPFFAYGLALYYGGLLVANEGLPYKDVIKVSEALIFGAWMLGQALAYAPNVNAAMISAGRLLQLLDRVPKMHKTPGCANENYDKIDATVSYKNVEFRYPTRPEIPVLQGLDLNISKGNTVALVGPSGCGKSTCLQLLLRYYDPDEGCINLNSKSSIDIPVDKLRSHLGLVSQEPVLFDRTIAENIAYGDNFREVPMQEIIDAAQKANIHEFVAALPLGYETRLGSKGAQLSGGQKQRVAIARALVRNPRILLLDEATSALDTHSEQVVQTALDSARAGRTCITIAHRLTTVQNADIICVLKGGVIVESGTHNTLMALNQIYARLYTLQKVS